MRASDIPTLAQKDMRVFIANGQRKIPLSTARISRLCKDVLKVLGLDEASLSLTFVGKRAISSLNKKYFKKDEPTDVIAFGYKSAGKGLYKNYIGDVIICPDVCLANCRRYGVSFTEELKLYIIHGILHLIGYDDRAKKENMRMRQKEQRMLKRV